MKHPGFTWHLLKPWAPPGARHLPWLALLLLLPCSPALAAIITFTQDATTNSTAMFQSGAAVSPVNGASAPLNPNGTTGYLFGHLFFNGEQRWSRNPIAEVVLVPSLLSTSARQALERDQGGYYGISVP
jgi:hypothetical protein